MKKIITIMLLVSSSLSFANQVTLRANQPMTVVYKIAHKNENAESVFGSDIKIDLQSQKIIAFDLNHYESRSRNCCGE